MQAAKANYTSQEQKNIELVTEYMQIAYKPGKASAEAVAHLCSPSNKFIAPTTFPDVHTLQEYAEHHGEVMRQVNDLHFVSFDVLFAKDDRVCLRYTVEGTHSGVAHNGIPLSGKKAQWTATGTFRVEDGKIIEFIKDWNKLSMWEQFGWNIEECLTQK